MSGTLRQFFRRFLRHSQPNPPPPERFPSPDQTAALERLLGTRDWRALESVWEHHWGEVAAALVTKGLSHEQYLYQSGYLEGIRRAAVLPHLYLARAKEPSRERPDDHRTERQSAIHINSDWWDAYQRERERPRGPTARPTVGTLAGS